MQPSIPRARKPRNLHMTEEAKGLDLPESVRKSLAAAVEERGVQARAISTQGRSSMKPPQGHVVIAASKDEIDGIRGPASIVRQLEFYKTRHGPVVRLAFSVFPLGGDMMTGDTLLNISQASGDAAISGLGRQKSIFFHFYTADGSGDLIYAFSKEINNAEEQRNDAKKILRMARETYQETPEDRRSFRSAVSLAERQFEPPEMPE